MKEWCIQHPWMTFFIIIFTIWSIFRGKKGNMTSLNYKEVLKMSNDKTNLNSGQRETNSRKPTTSKTYYNERGSQSVKPSLTSPPSPPPKQK